MDAKQEALVQKYNAATKALKDNKKSDGSMITESEFGLAYQRLVAAGMAQQIKRKYRGR
jgi:hypothetical protein